jgi:protein SCO1
VATPFGDVFLENVMQKIFLAGTLLAALIVLMPGRPEAQSRRWGEGYFPNLPVVTHDGKTVRFYDDLIKGKRVVISFIFTACKDFCPLTTARLTQVEEKLGERVGREIFFLSITVDPENDSAEKLKEYAESFHVGPGWKFVTGKPEDIRAINNKFGERMRSLTEHRNEIVLGNDVTGEWQRDNVLGDIDRVTISVLAMDPKWRDQVRAPPKSGASDTGLQMTGHPGQSMYKKICAPCHTIGVGDRVGPDLRGISARRDSAWLVSFIRNPHRMRAQKDPLALELAAKYPGVRMPSLGVTERDATDLIAYVDEVTSRLVETQGASSNHQHHGHDHHQHQPHRHH